jgi:hypothetical protein
MGLFSKNVSAITREKSLETARKGVHRRRDEMELFSFINVTTKGALTIDKFVAPIGFQFWWAKHDSWAEGKYFISIKQQPFGWEWLQDNHVIMALPDGTRLTFDHRAGWVGNVLDAGYVYEYKEMNVSNAVANLATIFDQDQPLRMRVGRMDYLIESRYFAYFNALKEEVERN